MDQLIVFIPSLLGIDAVTFYAALGVLVTICNLLGRFIPDSSTGPLGLLRKVAKVVGLYVGNRLTPCVSTNDVGRAIAAATADSKILETASQLQESVKYQIPAEGSLVPEEFRTDPMRTGAKRSTKVRSPLFASIGALILLILLAGCEPGQKERVESTIAAVCTSAPLAQALYNSAVESGDHNRVNQILNYLQATCPTVLILIQTLPAPAPVVIIPTPERG